MLSIHSTRPAAKLLSILPEPHLRRFSKWVDCQVIKLLIFRHIPFPARLEHARSLSGSAVAPHRDLGQKRSIYLGQVIFGSSSVDTRAEYAFLPRGGVLRVSAA